MDYVIKVELPEGHELHNQCRYYRRQAEFQFTDEFEMATRFETLEEANAALPKIRLLAVVWFGDGDQLLHDDAFVRAIVQGDPTVAKCSVVCYGG